jgi:hypothetical protein
MMIPFGGTAAVLGSRVRVGKMDSDKHPRWRRIQSYGITDIASAAGETKSLIAWKAC